jgi:hypothetical protein
MVEREGDMTQQEMDVLKEAVNIIVQAERLRFPEKDNEFWTQFHDVLLATVIERHKDLL